MSHKCRDHFLFDKHVGWIHHGIVWWSGLRCTGPPPPPVSLTMAIGRSLHCSERCMNLRAMLLSSPNFMSCFGPQIKLSLSSHLEGN